MARRILCMMRHGGTHLVKPVLKYTIGSSKGGKGPTLLKLPTDGRVIVCTRDPRNRIISAFRYKQFRITGKPNGEDVDDLLAQYMTARGIIGFMHEWADRWMGLSNAHYIRFEDFHDEHSVIQAVSGAAAYEGISVTEDDIRAAWKKFYKNSPTYTGRHSRWQDWFGPRCALAWEEGNGGLLTKKMGYE